MNNFVCMMMESKNSQMQVVEVPFYLNVDYITDITEDRNRDPQQDNATVYVQLKGDDEPLTFRHYRGGAHGFMADMRRQRFNGPAEPQYDPTCGGIHKPFSEIVWPEHCHVRRCPRCNRDYPI